MTENAPAQTTPECSSARMERRPWKAEAAGSNPATQTSFEILEMGRVPVKAWTRGVPVEDVAREQLRNTASLPFVFKHVAVMPDVHWGIGATVGSVMATKGAIVPAAVGVDIGCVDADTEYLSPEGWVKISEYHENGLVMQYDPDLGIGTFVKPSNYVKQECDEFYFIKTKYGVNQVLSPEHRVLCWKVTGRDRKRERTVITAKELAEEHLRLVQGINVEFETTFEPSIGTQLDISDIDIRIQVMVNADGYLDVLSNGGVSAVLGFKKQRKIDRCRSLLIKSERSFTENKYDDTTVFRFKPPYKTKQYYNFWKASHEQLKIIADECLHWDGNIKERCFYSRDRASADFIQYVFSTTGTRGVLRADKHKKDGIIDYRVFSQPNTRVGLKGVPKTPITKVSSRDGNKYCFTVPTGFWVMRRGGNITMTGNCGMVAARLSITANELPDSLAAVRSAIEAAVPHGRTDNGGVNDRGAWGQPPADVLWHFGEKGDNSLSAKLLDIVDKHTWLSRAAKKAHNHLGTLGTGNHFIEICLDESNAVWVMLHSGSRGIGNAIGSYFIGRAKQQMERYFISLPDKDLAYLPEGTDDFKDYLAAVGWAQDFAKTNRQIMLARTVKAIAAALGRDDLVMTEEAVNCHHNYVSRESHFGQNVLVTRKGAVRAREGDLGIIPGSMGARSFIVRGKGNPDSFQSCSHGAGRKMSRSAAKKAFTLADHETATAGVECRKDIDVIDETPGAYKDVDAVMAAQADLIDVVHTLKQVVCVKG